MDLAYIQYETQNDQMELAQRYLLKNEKKTFLDEKATISDEIWIDFG